jgi:hypothetical protein
MSRRIRLTNAEWDAVAGSVARRVADLVGPASEGADPDAIEREVAALTRSMDKIADMMRPTRRPRGNPPTVEGPG